MGPPEPGDVAWGTDDSGATFYWDENVAQELAEQNCTGASTPLIIERDGRYYPSCASTGIVFAPPFDSLALTELLFPDNWEIIPPG